MRVDLIKFVADCIGPAPQSIRWEGPFILHDIETDSCLIKRDIGVYKLYRKGISKIWYVGRAIEYKNGGLRKRLRDYVRPNDSARKSGVGPQAYIERESVTVWVSYTGKDHRAAQVARLLELALIKKFKPLGNKQK